MDGAHHGQHRKSRNGIGRTRTRRRAAGALAGAFAAVAVLSASASAEPSPPPADCTLSGPETRMVATVNDGDSLTLTDGTVVRLIGTKAPAAPLGWRGDRPWPLVAEAKEALSQLASGRRNRASLRRHPPGSSWPRPGPGLRRQGRRTRLAARRARRQRPRPRLFLHRQSCLRERIAGSRSRGAGEARRHLGRLDLSRARGQRCGASRTSYTNSR